MSKALTDLLEILNVEELEVNLFRGRSPESDSQRVFGGQVLGQALTSAGRTVEDAQAHSLHAYFLRPGDPTAPILYQVERTRDGRSFTTRRVTAIQRGRAIFQLEASFHAPEPGYEHQSAMPDAPDPETLPTRKQMLAPYLAKLPKELRHWAEGEVPIERRHLVAVNPLDPEKQPPRMLVWIRADGRLPDDPVVHQCVVAYASDQSLLNTAMLPYGVGWADRSHQVASLDHAMWFHRPLRADEWLLYEQESPAAAGARAFSSGRLFARDGRLVASVVQEGLLRPPRER